MEKATFKESYYTRNGRFQLKCLVYEYKGRTYDVFMGDTQDTLYEQHKMQQAYIDREIEIQERSKNNTNGNDAFEDFDFFMSYVNGEVDADGNKLEV